MKQLIVHIFVGLGFLLVGVWFGYDRGVKNHIYFDAPAKIALYDAYLKSGKAADYMEGEVMYQVGLLDSMENDVTPFLLNHPIHEGMEVVYKEYRPKIEVLSRVSDARDELKKHTRNGVDDSDEAPIP
jgi:hypothetical protein